MRYRGKQSKSRSRSGFRRGAGVNKRNFQAGPMRGGIRL